MLTESQHVAHLIKCKVPPEEARRRASAHANKMAKAEAGWAAHRKKSEAARAVLPATEAAASISPASRVGKEHALLAGIGSDELIASLANCFEVMLDSVGVVFAQVEKVDGDVGRVRAQAKLSMRHPTAHLAWISCGMHNR